MKSRDAEPTCSDALPAADDYARQLDKIEVALKQDALTDQRFALVRVGLFFGLVVGTGFALATMHPLWILITAGNLFGFLIAVVLNERVRDAMTAHRNRAQTLRRLVARTRRDWPTLQADRLTKLAASLDLDGRQKAISGDLDLVGPISLFQLINLSGTLPGMRMLVNWICDPASAETARRRHNAVIALTSRRDDRIRFYTLAREVGSGTGDPDHFIEWSQRPNWLPGHSWLIPWANLTGSVALLVLIAMLTSPVWLSASWTLGDVIRLGGLALLTIAILNLLIASVLMGKVAEIFAVAMSSRRQVEEYAELFNSATWLPPRDDGGAHPIAQTLLGDSVTESSDKGIRGCTNASAGMRELAAVAKLGGLKQSAATFLIYLPLQAFALWDARVLRRLEKWKDRHGPHVACWFHALGELEVLLSLAALRDENPAWASPQWVDQTEPTAARRLTATALGHPLLPDTARVTNDVSVGPAGSLLLVTGSNMSGKSTLLRSVGLNAALAMAGGPVCCRSLLIPAIELATSIRVTDDLGRGVSFYMAELNRLAEVVRHAQKVSQQTEADRPLVLFLLDEILQGTNSRERQIAVTRVLRHLVESGAIGAITTHDLELADEPELRRISSVVHFRETIVPDAQGDQRMTFDYKMKQGVSPTTNALKLLELVGLGDQKSA